MNEIASLKSSIGSETDWFGLCEAIVAFSTFILLIGLIIEYSPLGWRVGVYKSKHFSSKTIRAIRIITDPLKRRGLVGGEKDERRDDITEFVGACIVTAAIIIELLFVCLEIASSTKLRLMNDKLQSDMETGLINALTESEKLRCENIALEKIMAPRVLAPSRLNKRTGPRDSERVFINDIGTYSKVPVKIQTANDTDAQRIRDDLVYLLKQANWAPDIVDESKSQFLPSEIRDGIKVYKPIYESDDLNDQRAALITAFRDTGLIPSGPIGGNAMPPQLGVTGPSFLAGNAGFIYVAIGARPMEQELEDLKEHPPTSCN